jgi:serine O-acetyltransferase
MRIICCCEISPFAEIGEHCDLVHFIGVVIGAKVKIGNGVCIFQGVTLGKTGRDNGVPTIEDNVCIGAGAKILGAITIGKGSVIGANSVVTKDVPPKSLVVGIPGRIIKSNIIFEEYRY